MEDNGLFDDNSGQNGIVNSQIYKSASILVDLAKYQNIKLYASCSMVPDAMSSEEEIELNKKMWADRGTDLKYGLKACLREFAGMDKPTRKPKEKTDKADDLVYATIRKGCEITVEIIKTQNTFQNAKFSSSKEWKIGYSTEDERIEIEKDKWNEIAEDAKQSMSIFFEALGKKTDAQEKFAELCRQRMIIKKVEKVEEKAVVPVEANTQEAPKLNL